MRLDRIETLPQPRGTAPRERTVPADYASSDVIGSFKAATARREVTVELSAVVATSAFARVWQRDEGLRGAERGKADTNNSVAIAEAVGGEWGVLRFDLMS